VLIVTLLNVTPGDAHQREDGSADYEAIVRVNEHVIWAGLVVGHRRDDGPEALLQLLAERMAAKRNIRGGGFLPARNESCNKPGPRAPYGGRAVKTKGFSKVVEAFRRLKASFRKAGAKDRRVRRVLHQQKCELCGFEYEAQRRGGYRCPDCRRKGKRREKPAVQEVA
jgi:predicted Zn-ribbon and HTH transcriptional regulator